MVGEIKKKNHFPLLPELFTTMPTQGKKKERENDGVGDACDGGGEGEESSLFWYNTAVIIS